MLQSSTVVEGFQWYTHEGINPQLPYLAITRF